MSQKIFFGIILLNFILNSNAVYQSCDDETKPSGDVINVNISGCDDLEVCPLSRGNNVNISVTFRPDKAVSKVKNAISGKLGPVFIPLMMPRKEANGCVQHGLDCPLEADKEYVYNGTVRIMPSYPPIKVLVKWKLINLDGGDTIVCILIPSVIV